MSNKTLSVFLSAACVSQSFQLFTLCFFKLFIYFAAAFSIACRKEVHLNSVRWNKTLEFECRIGRNLWTGKLQDCVCRVSVMGFADINLSEFAGSGFQIRHSILEMYDSRASKPDNSILKVGIQMQLLAGDPCFRVPSSTTNTATLPEVRPSVSNANTEPQGTSSDFGGAPRNKAPPSGSVTDMFLLLNTHPEHGTLQTYIPVTISSFSPSLTLCPGPSSDSLLHHFEVCGSLSPETVPQDIEQQERVAVAGQLSRVGKTRLDARDVVENLCLEYLGQETDLVPPAEGKN
ncbi:protein FAM102A-like [Polyodon spathula]|uniref:protein FAM102A-like n=1 Tax=Polyodon spathula TaxID=7913 RepID=UPI001B7F2100|nr:protein FAM102A-like [Polyodon spathula]